MPFFCLGMVQGRLDEGAYFGLFIALKFIEYVDYISAEGIRLPPQRVS